jgi:peptidoglycan DL-endopeptidase CwlO
MWLCVSARTHGVKRVVAVAGVVALTSVVFSASAGHAEPSIDQVEHRLDALYHEAEAAQERLNTLNVQLAEREKRLRALRSDLRERRRHYRNVSDMVAAMAAEEAQNVRYQLSRTQQFLFADDPDELLDRIAAEEALSTEKGETLTRLTTVSRRLHLQQSRLSRELVEVRADQQQAAREEDTVDAKVAQAEDLLAELEAERRARLREARTQERREARARAQEAASHEPSRSVPRPTTSSPVSGGAAEAVDFALDQVGDAYVYGAAGPDAWDCSGLTMQAWAAAGVSLPHSSSSQYYSGTHVSTSDLQPGDLVFYYQPISHVALYIGDGQIVHASNPSEPVNVAPVGSMPITGAVRPG